MNTNISAVLHEHADDDVHIERLLGAVHAGVRRRRQVRTALAGGAVVVLAALVGVTGATPSQQPATPAAGPGPDILRPPGIAGMPVATKVPQVLGANPSLFHLDLSGLTGWQALSWSSRSGHEELLVDTPAGGQIRIEADRDVNRLEQRSGETWPTTVAGKEAQATAAAAWYAFRWQPVPGIWAQAISTENLQAAVDVAAKLRLDHVYRCAVPFKLTGLTPARLVQCQTTTYATGDAEAATVWFKTGTSEPEYEVSSYADQPPTATNGTIAGRAVQVNHPNPTDARQLGLEIIYPYGPRTAYFWGFYGPDEAVLRSAVAGFTPVTAEDPNSWPSSPF